MCTGRAGDTPQTADCVASDHARTRSDYIENNANACTVIYIIIVPPTLLINGHFIGQRCTSPAAQLLQLVKI